MNASALFAELCEVIDRPAAQFNLDTFAELIDEVGRQRRDDVDEFADGKFAAIGLQRVQKPQQAQYVFDFGLIDAGSFVAAYICTNRLSEQNGQFGQVAAQPIGYALAAIGYTLPPCRPALYLDGAGHRLNRQVGLAHTSQKRFKISAFWRGCHFGGRHRDQGDGNVNNL